MHAEEALGKRISRANDHLSDVPDSTLEAACTTIGSATEYVDGSQAS